MLLLAAEDVKGPGLVVLAALAAPFCYWLGRRYLRIGRELSRGERNPSIDLETAVLTPKIAAASGYFLLAAAAGFILMALVELARLAVG